MTFVEEPRTGPADPEPGGSSREVTPVARPPVVTDPPTRARLCDRTGPRLRVAVLAAAGMTCSMMQTLVTPLFPILPDLLDSTPATTSWVLTATVLSAAVFTPITGRLGDMYGKKRVMLAVLGVMLVGSVVSGLAPSAMVLIIGRALQGVGLGVIPLGMSILREILPRDRVPGAVALMSSTLGIGGALGLPLGGLAVQHLNWHSAFWLSAVLAATAAAAIALLVPDGSTHPARFDPIGAVGIALGTSLLLLALSKGADWGWASAATLGCAAAGVVSLVLWARFEWNHHDPLIDLHTAARWAAALTHVAAIASGFVLYAPMVLMPILFQMHPYDGRGFGLGAFSAALLSMPAGLMMMVASPIAGRLIRAWGGRLSLIVGAVINGSVFLLMLAVTDQLWAMAILGAILGVGTGFSYSALPTLTMDAVPDTEIGAANGFNTLMRYFGTALASTLVMTILAAHSASGTTEAIDASGFTVSLIVATGGAVMILLPALLLPRRV